MARASAAILSPRPARPRRRRRSPMPVDPMPRDVAPMLAVLAADLPSDGKNWAFEYKWDGVPAIAQLVRSVPILYVLFDVLYLDGRSLFEAPYLERRAMLEELTLAGPSWQVTPSHVDRGKAMLDAARENALEGVVAKRLDSLY